MKQDRNGKYLSTRKVYKDVKKMDHQQFDDFCTGIYREGFNDGRESVPGIDIAQVKETILGVKGIGEKKVQSIMDALEEKFEGGEKNSEEHVI